MGKKSAAKMSLAHFHTACGPTRGAILASRSQGSSRANGRLTGKIARDFGVDGRADAVEGECENWKRGRALGGQAVEGHCGEVTQQWTDPVLQGGALNWPASLVGAEAHEFQDVCFAEAVARSNATFAAEVAAHSRGASEAPALSTPGVNGQDYATIAPDAPLSISHLLKASLGTDRRRLSVSWLPGTSTRLIFESIYGAISNSFSDRRSGGVAQVLRLTYLDDEGDECTLVGSTVEDFLAFAGNSALKLRVVWLAMLGSDDASDKAAQDFSIASPAPMFARPAPVAIGERLDEGVDAGHAIVEEFSLATPRGVQCADSELEALSTPCSSGGLAQDWWSDAATPDVLSEGIAGACDRDSASVDWTNVSGLGCEAESCEMGCGTSSDDFEFA